MVEGTRTISPVGERETNAIPIGVGSDVVDDDGWVASKVTARSVSDDKDAGRR